MVAISATAILSDIIFSSSLGAPLPGRHPIENAANNAYPGFFNRVS
jgi:hypothetical protein